MLVDRPPVLPDRLMGGLHRGLGRLDDAEGCRIDADERQLQAHVLLVEQIPEVETANLRASRPIERGEGLRGFPLGELIVQVTLRLLARTLR